MSTSNRSNGPVEELWDLLGKKLSLLFGRECAKVSIWMFFALIIRNIIIILKLDKYIPNGFIYALPLFIQILGKYIPFISNDSFPLLPIRLTESILGRITPARLAIIIPAHFLGCIVGVIMFKILIPILRLSDDVLKPITYGPNNWMFGWIYALSLESLLICIYICIVIALPVMLELNKISPLLLSLPIIPLMFFMLPDQGSTFNPAAIYALWYANGGKTLFDSELQPEHIIAPMIGSICAGIICSRYFPDDPNSWKQKQQRYR